MTNLEAAEILFAQKLASGEPTTRLRAFRRLRKWIQDSSAGFVTDDLRKLWKGLYYCMWMQDKPLIQEELAESISNLVDCFDTVDGRIMFMETFVETLGKEWHKIDRWRMDKYMMFFRRFVRRFLDELCTLAPSSAADEIHKDDNSTPSLRSLLGRLFDAWRTTVLNPASDGERCPDGLKYHFLAVYLDEIDRAGGGVQARRRFTTDDVTFCLDAPFRRLLADKRTSDNLFDTAMTEIFETILRAYSEQLAADADGNGNTADDGDQIMAEQSDAGGIKFDYKAIGKFLFDVGSAKSVVGWRRRKLFDFSKRFNLAAAGKDPFEDELIEYNPREHQITSNDLDAAARRYLSRIKADNEQTAAMRVRAVQDRGGVKTKKRRRRFVDDGDSDGGDGGGVEDGVTQNGRQDSDDDEEQDAKVLKTSTKKKKRPVKPSKSKRKSGKIQPTGPKIRKSIGKKKGIK